MLVRKLKKFPLFPANIFTILFLAITSSLLTWQSLTADIFMPGSYAIEKQPNLILYHLIFHGLIICWLLIQDVLPNSFEVPVYLPVLFLFSSYIYYVSFFAAEYATAYPFLYAQALWLTGSVYIEKQSNNLRKRLLPLVSVLIPLGLFILALAVSSVFSYSSYESWNQLSQIAIFGFLTAVMAITIQNRKIWKATAGALIIIGGIPWIWLGLVKFLQLTSQFGWKAAASYRLFLGGVGPNWIDYISVTLLPLTVGLCFSNRKLIFRVFWGSVACGLFLLLIYSQSGQGLSGWLGLVSSLLIIALFYLLLWRRLFIKLVLILIPVGFILVMAFILFSIPQFQKFNPASLYTRIYGWQTIIHNIKDHPLVGTGLAIRFPNGYYGDQVSWGQTNAPIEWVASKGNSMLLKQLQLSYHSHNLFLEIADGAGLPALVFFLWYLFSLAHLGWKVFRNSQPQNRMFIITCIAGIVGSLGWGMIDVMDYSPPFFTFPVWALIGLLLAAPNALSQPNPDSDMVSPKISVRKSVISSIHIPNPYIVILIALISLLVVVRPVISTLYYQQAYRSFQQENWQEAINSLTSASNWEPTNPKYNEMRGEALINFGKYDEALIAYQQALEVRKNYSADLIKIGWLYWFKGDLQKAQESFQKAVIVDPLEAFNSGAHSDLALTYVVQDRLSDAIPLFVKSIELHPEIVNNSYWLPIQKPDGKFDVVLDPGYKVGNGNPNSEISRRILVNLGMADYTQRLLPRVPESQSILSLKVILDLIEKDYQIKVSSDQVDAPELLSSLTKASNQAGFKDQTERLYRLFISNYPNSSTGYQGLATLLVAQNHWDEASGVYDQAVKNGAINNDILRGIAKVAEKKHDSVTFTKTLEQAKFLNPFDYRIYEILANSANATEDNREEVLTLKNLVLLGNSNQFQKQLADAYLQNGMTDQATDQCIQFSNELFKEWVRAYDYSLLEAAQCISNFPEQKRQSTLKEFVKIRPFTGSVLIGHVYRILGQETQAIQAYQNAIQSNPSNAAPHYFMGESYVAQGDIDAGMEEYRRAVEINPIDPLPLISLAHLEWSDNQKEQSLKEYQQAVEIAPGWDEAQYLLGNALFALGDRVGAAEHYRLAKFASGAREDEYYSFTEHLTDANIKSPNPEYIKIDQFSVNGVTRKVLFMHPNSRAAYSLQLPNSDTLLLHFDVSLAPDSWSLEGDGVEFLITVISSNKEDKVFDLYLDPKNKEVDRRWVEDSIDLRAFAGQHIQIVFETRCGPANDLRYDWAGWGEPQILIDK